MVFSFLESIKYIAPFWPLSLLRIGLGVSFLRDAWFRLGHRGATLPWESLQLDLHGTKWEAIIDQIILPHADTFIRAASILEFALAVSLIFGFWVRPVTFLLSVLVGFLLTVAQGLTWAFLFLLFLLSVLFCVVGAGRCLGFDFYFYKRIRGLWW